MVSHGAPLPPVAATPYTCKPMGVYKKWLAKAPPPLPLWQRLPTRASQWEYIKMVSHGAPPMAATPYTCKPIGVYKNG